MANVGQNSLHGSYWNHIQAERIVLAELVRDRAWRLSGPTGRGKPVGVGSFSHYFTGFQVDMVNISHSLQTWFKNIPGVFFRISGENQPLVKVDAGR